MEVASVQSHLHAAFGLALRNARHRVGLSQEGLAAKAGLDRTYVSGVERGTRNPTLAAMRKLADGAEIALSDLVKDAEARAKG